jgi:hypothetical protein
MSGDLHDYRHRDDRAGRDLIVLPGPDGTVELRGHGVGVRDGDRVMYTDEDVYRVAQVRYDGHRWTATGRLATGAGRAAEVA